MKKKIFFLTSLMLILSLTGCGLSLGDGGGQKQKTKTLTYWRVFDGKDAFQEIIKEYEKRHPNVKIKYKKLRYDNYREELLNAMAEDRGPDIFSINNSWMKEYKSKISPLPDRITVKELTQKGVIKKEAVLKEKTKDALSLKDIEDKFIDVVYDDAVIENKKGLEKIYGLPLAVDTLAMYYNKDLLNNAGIASPPEYWNRTFQKNVKKMTKQDSKGKIIQSGVAMGGSENIERASDVLSVLMMQNKATMMTESGNVLFTESRPDGSAPGLEALRFYTDFSNPAKEVYCWNSNLDNSLKKFTEGNLALMFGYSYHLPTIKSRAPKLDFSVAPLPQIENQEKINHANYWMEVVSQKSEHKEVAWDFLMFATKKKQAQKYLQETNNPTALRSLVDKQVEDREIGVFAKQLLTAESWYEGYDYQATEDIMKDMIKQANQNPEEIEEALNRGASRVQQTTIQN